MNRFFCSALMVLVTSGVASAQPVPLLSFESGGGSGPFMVTPGSQMTLECWLRGDSSLLWEYIGGLLDPSTGISVLDFTPQDPPFTVGPIFFSAFSQDAQGPDTMFGSLTLEFDPTFTGGTLGVIQESGNPTHGTQGPNCFGTYDVAPAQFVVPAPGTGLGLVVVGLFASRRRR